MAHGRTSDIAGEGRSRASRGPFGMLGDGRTVDRVTLRNRRGTTASVITYGAALQSLVFRGRDGTQADIVLGHDDAESYRANRQFFGATIGRYANRIAGGGFDLDGRGYRVDTNDGGNMLHGGGSGFDTALWDVVAVDDEHASVELRHVSPDGDGGFPGTLVATVRYTLTDADELVIDHIATTDAPTVVNLTNHSFFNLAGGGTVEDHRLTLFASHFTPVDATLIPTGERRAVAGTAFDFRSARQVGDRLRDGSDPQLRIARGYDHNFIVDGQAGTLRPAARLEHPGSGRVLDLLVTAPGVQFYSGNFLDATVCGKGGRLYRQGDALCLEPQGFPDSPNHPDFPSTRLDPGETYRSTISLRLSIES